MHPDDGPVTLALMELQVSRPELLGALIEALRGAGCACAQLASDRCAVWHCDASDPREARVELVFFLRAWTLQHEPIDVRFVH